ncbi:starvation-inducible DNA-binding protein [Rhodoligotrophos appendicifer]|uniref:Dps family protein n=1 Tax=Rhodoligotrophos appendicifer TaxID=987056 RepID=UPI001184C9E0|nr:Dps family protein [Rhodoligotrophos appendicifer]
MRNDETLSAEEKKTLAHGLSRVLADSFKLYQKTHGFHWNIEAANFHDLHLMLEEQYRDIWDAVDVIAERIRALGHYAPSTATDFSQLSEIEEERGVPEAKAMLKQLVADNETVVRTMRDIRPKVEEAGDTATGSMLDDRLQVHDKYIWMLKATLKDGGKGTKSVLETLT